VGWKEEKDERVASSKRAATAGQTEREQEKEELRHAEAPTAENSKRRAQACTKETGGRATRAHAEQSGKAGGAKGDGICGIEQQKAHMHKVREERMSGQASLRRTCE